MYNAKVTAQFVLVFALLVISGTMLDTFQLVYVKSFVATPGVPANVAATRLKDKYVAEAMPPPVIIGGFGDSGTRAIQHLFVTFGVYMGSPRTLNLNSDSLLFMQRRSTIDTTGLNANDFEGSVWNEATQFVSKMLLDHVHDVVQENQESKLWGFKHPRTALMLPFIHSTIGDNFKYIHVIRDGREIATGQNTRYFRHQCTRILSKRDCNVTSISDHIRFWGKLNFFVVSWAKENLRPENFAVLRIEDLVQGNVECVRHALETAGIGNKTDAQISKSIEQYANFKSHYFGNRWDDAGKQAILDTIKRENIGNVDRKQYIDQALHRLGYNTETFGLSTGCGIVKLFGFGT